MQSERDYLLLTVWRLCRQHRDRRLDDEELWAKLQEAFDYVREFSRPSPLASRPSSFSAR